MQGPSEDGELSSDATKQDLSTGGAASPNWRDEANPESRRQGMHAAARRGEPIPWAEVEQVEADYKRWCAANLFGVLGHDGHPGDELTREDRKPTTLVELLRKMKRQRGAAPKMGFEQSMEIAFLENLFFRGD